MNFLSLHIYLSPHPIIYIHTHHNYFSNNHHFLHIIISQLFSGAIKMMMSRNCRKGDAGSWLFGVVLMGLILVGCIRESCGDGGDGDIRGKQLLDQRPCDEIYVVGEGETLHTISHKCNDPFIVERNPHVHDPDDVFPGLVIKIIPTNLQ